MYVSVSTHAPTAGSRLKGSWIGFTTGTGARGNEALSFGGPTDHTR